MGAYDPRSDLNATIYQHYDVVYFGPEKTSWMYVNANPGTGGHAGSPGPGNPQFWMEFPLDAFELRSPGDEILWRKPHKISEKGFQLEKWYDKYAVHFALSNQQPPKRFDIHVKKTIYSLAYNKEEIIENCYYRNMSVNMTLKQI